jgi:hypothetical protein
VRLPLTQSGSTSRQKKSWLEIVSEPAQTIYILTSLSSDSNDDTDGGGCNGARCTCSTKGPWNSRSTDKVDSIHMGNSHIRTDSCCSSHTDKLDNQTQLLRPQFRLKPARQNAARERKPIRTPSMQLTEAFSL